MEGVLHARLFPSRLLSVGARVARILPSGVGRIVCPAFPVVFAAAQMFVCTKIGLSSEFLSLLLP